MNMAVSGYMLATWKKFSALLLAEHGMKPADVRSPIDAWNVAHRLQLPREAYHVGLRDSHIETALRHIFPNAWGTPTPGRLYRMQHATASAAPKTQRVKAAKGKKSYLRSKARK